MKGLSLRLISLIPTLPKLATPRQMEPLIKATLESEVFSEHPRKSLRKRKATVLRSQPASSDSELSPLSDEGPVIVKKPAKKKRKVATKTKVVLNERYSAAADAANPGEMTRSRRKVRAAVAEADILEYTQESQLPKKRKRKSTVIEPVVYNIPDVERKEATFKGELHLQIFESSLMAHSLHFRSIRICEFLAPPISHWQY